MNRPARNEKQPNSESSRIQSKSISLVGARDAGTSRLRINDDSYHSETLRPIVCLAFTVPLLMFYEIGAIYSDHRAGRSGLDEWLHWLLSNIGIGQLVVLPILTVAILLSWHHRLEDGWKIRPTVLAGMVIESTGLGLILYWAASALFQAFESSQLMETADHLHRLSIMSEGVSENWWANTVAYIGCGVYEELVFRLILLTMVIKIGSHYFDRQHAVQVIGMLATSILFAGLHYNVFNPAGVDFEFQGFAFRFLASMVFCVLFLFRGFGIAVGAHVTYDVLTQL